MEYYVRVEPNVNIYVEDVFIHGWPANHKLFEYQFDVLPAMGYRCIGRQTISAVWLKRFNCKISPSQAIP